MGRIRSAVWVATVTVPATDSAYLDATQMLRDILPDQSFRLHSVGISLRHSMEIADRADLTMAKNITPIPGATADQIVVTHGVLIRVEHIGTNVAGNMSGENWFIPFPTPLDFDRDDSLNMRVSGSNTAATAQQVYGIITINYEA